MKSPRMIPSSTASIRRTLATAAAVAAILLALVSSPVRAQETKELRIGMVGIDTSHATAFTGILNDPENQRGHVPGGKVVAAVKQFSADIESSASRVDEYVETLKTQYGVTFYDSIAEMCQHVDAVMIESVDGRPHLEQARPVIEAGLPLFVDKPMSASLKDVLAIFDLAKQHEVPVWSSSNLRFHEGVIKAATADIGDITYALSYGPAPTEEHHPDLMWYGIHPSEALFTVMGPGCETVARTYTEGTDLVTGTWKDGRIGSVMGIRSGKRIYGVKVFGTKGTVEESAGAAYPELVTEVIKFFQTGTPPVSAETTIELFAFMEAADESKRQGGAPVSIADYIAKQKP